jgi:membrane peptidoglycan carboxypeptidase
MKNMSAFPTPLRLACGGPRPCRRRLIVAFATVLAVLLVAPACSIPRPHLLPDSLTIPPLPQTSIIYDANGRFITTLHAGEDRTLIGIDQVPVIARDAVIAAEDERFYHHHGVDVKAIARATVRNYATGRIVEGASTITEQLVKNTIGTDERTFTRKVREAEMAYELEDRYSKDQILEMYLNTVYFGQGAHGIQAAAKTYFSIPASKLTLEQGALLAALIRSPSSYDPVYHPEVALERRNLVLGRMRDLHIIDGPTYLEATRKDLGLDLYEGSPRYPAPYFVDYVKRWFLSNEEFGTTPQERYDRLFKGGLRIHSTVDLRLQRFAERAVHSILAYRRDPYGAMTVIDPRTGAIKAMVGGRDFFSRKDRIAQLNLATGGATGRSAGSSFKPFALVAALDKGISPLTVYRAPSHIAIPLPRGSRPPVWPVDNYDGEGGGNMTLEQATINSVNTVYAQVIMQVGPQAVVDAAHQMGITRKLRAVPSAVLGTNEVDTLQMASAYGSLATVGKWTPPVAVAKITDSRGKVIYESEPDLQQVLNPGVAWTADQILQKVVLTGTGSQANIGRPVGGKTGTGQRWTDAWFVGFIPQLVAAVWVGFPKGRVPMVYPKVRIPHVLGGTWPAEIWHAFMTNATRGMPVEKFRKPSFGYVSVAVDVRRGCLPNHWTLPEDIDHITYIAGTQPARYCTEPSGPQMVRIPSVVGLSQEKAVELLKSYGFLAFVTTVDSTKPAGTVLAVDPGAGTRILQGGVVTLTVASGIPPPPIPSPSPSPSPPPSPPPSPSPSPSPSA